MKQKKIKQKKNKNYFQIKFSDFFKKKLSSTKIEKERSNEKSLSKSIH